MKTVFAPGMRRLISVQWACIGDMMSAMQGSTLGKYFWISRLTLWQQDEITTSR